MDSAHRPPVCTLLSNLVILKGAHRPLGVKIREGVSGGYKGWRLLLAPWEQGQRPLLPCPALRAAHAPVLLCIPHGLGVPLPDHRVRVDYFILSEP